MTMKDYKSQTSSAQPPAKKDAGNKGIFKKTAISFGVGFLLGLTVAGVFCMQYLDGDNTVSRAANGEPVAPDATDKPQSEPSPTSPAKERSIDYQFYEELAKFELPEPVQDDSVQSETDEPLLQDDTDKEIRQELDSEKADKKESPTRYILQAGTYTDSQKAQMQRRKIIDLGYYKEVHIFQTIYDDKQYYRVWLGPYGDIERAKAVGNVLKAAQVEVMLRHDLRRFNPKEK